MMSPAMMLLPAPESSAIRNRIRGFYHLV